jgi:peptidoglycan/LPS O-acetylase OafA/YrhL
VGGRTAVESFYIISGFYMSLIINEKYVGLNKSYKLFITNRFLRLFPIYWVILLLTILAYVIHGIFSINHSYSAFDLYSSVSSNPLSLIYLIVAQIILFGQDLVYFLGVNPSNGHLFFTSNFAHTDPQLWNFILVPQSWTLGIELTFYLIAPFILRRGLKVVVPIIVLSLLLRMSVYRFLGFDYDPWTYRFFPFEILFFLLGYISYRISLKLKERSIKKQYGYYVLIFIIAITLLYQFEPTIKVRHIPFSLNDVFYYTCMTLGMPVLFNVFKKSKIDNKIGELSYPVYISHILVYFLAALIPVYFFQTGLFVAIATIGISLILNKLIADPIEKLRQARLAK